MNTTKTRHYRVIAITTNDFGAYNAGKPSDVTEAVKWSGTDLDELSRHYPPSEIFGADPLGHSEIEDGLIRYDYRFERQREDGSWEKIDDPRRRITTMTDLEREIDAENRRRFPGDYITDDEDDYYDSYNYPDYGYEDEPEYEPNCRNCDDRGCEQCDPETFPPQDNCGWCGRWFEVKLLNDHGLCTECETERLEELKPHCVDCHKVVDKEGTLCQECQDYWDRYESEPRCIDCQQVHADPKLVDGDICRECDDYWHNQYKSYYRWYKRLWRWVMRRQ